MIAPPDLQGLDHAAKDALILSLVERINALMSENAALKERLARLEEKLGLPPKTPDNSSTPPSRGMKSSGETGLARRGKAHKGSHRTLHPDPTRTIEVTADACGHCGADVTGAQQHAAYSYDRIELPEIKPDVTRVVLQGGVCPCCRRRFRAEAPEGLEPGSPFGPNLRAFVVYLRAAHAISFERLSRAMSDLFSLDISEGALVNIFNDSRSSFEKGARRIRDKLRRSAVLQSDETSLRVKKQTWWAWVFHHKDSAAFVVAPSRGKDVVERFLGTRRPDYWVSDRLAAQMGWAKKNHQVCLAHLMRDVQYAIDAGDDAFAPHVLDLLAQACAIGRRRESLADATLKSHERKLDVKLGRLLNIEANGAPGEKLKRVFKKYRQNLSAVTANSLRSPVVFVTRRDLPPTNNGSEQAIRPLVVFRKVTNCFRSQWGAELYADIRSVLETARRRAVGPLQAIRLTLNGLPIPAVG